MIFPSLQGKKKKRPNATPLLAIQVSPTLTCADGQTEADDILPVVVVLLDFRVLGFLVSAKVDGACSSALEDGYYRGLNN